jgi:hypothetical protein
MISTKSLILVFTAIFVTSAVVSVSAQRRDYMTEAEIELVRDAQNIDERVDVLTKMIDRRIALLGADPGVPIVEAKETGKWGSAPTGSRFELLDDVRKLLQKAIDDIDNVAAHPVDYAADKDRSEKQKKKDALRFPNAVRSLAASAKRYMPILKTLLDRSKDEKERGIMMESIEFCEQIVEAVGKLTP